MKSLDDRKREYFTEHYQDLGSIKEVAKGSGCCEKTVRKYVNIEGKD